MSSYELRRESATVPRRSSAHALDTRISLLRDIAHADQRLEGVLLYGSWTLGEADAHSDLDAYLFVNDADADTFDGRAFVEQLAPLKLAYTNMYGILAVVFDDLMRGSSMWRRRARRWPRWRLGVGSCTFPTLTARSCSIAPGGSPQRPEPSPSTNRPSRSPRRSS